MKTYPDNCLLLLPDANSILQTSRLALWLDGKQRMVKLHRNLVEKVILAVTEPLPGQALHLPRGEVSLPRSLHPPAASPTTL